MANRRANFRPTNLFVHTDIQNDVESELKAEMTSLTSQLDGNEAANEGNQEDSNEEDEEEEYCWRRFWCFCCNRCRARKRRLDGSGRRKESDYGVLIIVAGLAVFSVFYFFSRSSVYKISQLHSPPWTYHCDEDSQKCIRTPVFDNGTELISLGRCAMTCGHAHLWPRPTGVISLGNKTINFLPGDIKMLVDRKTPNLVRDLARGLRPILRDLLFAIHPAYAFDERNPFRATKSGGRLTIRLCAKKADSHPHAETIATDESYEISILQTEIEGPPKAAEDTLLDSILVDIKAATFFGLRNAVETFAQMVQFDELTESLLIHERAFISDKPVFPFRALRLDTSVNFLSVDTISHVIDAMSFSKFNFLQWKMTGSESFAFNGETIGELSRHGAFTHEESYSNEEIIHLRDYALMRGIRIIPVFDVYDAFMGWNQIDPDLVSQCDQCETGSICGQLNEASKNGSIWLQRVAYEYGLAFGSRLSHFGYNQYDQNCQEDPNLQPKLRSEWKERLLERRTAYLKSFILPWTKELDKTNLNASQDIIQITHESQNYLEEASRARDLGLDVIITHKLCKDCIDFPWGEGSESSISLETWQNKTYLGAELSLPDNLFDDKSIQQKLWPRAALFSQMLWTGQTDLDLQKTSLSYHRQRLVSRGIPAQKVMTDYDINH